jgi:hypothetical protein
MTDLTESVTRLNEFYKKINNVSTNNAVEPQERVDLNSSTVQKNIKKLPKEELIERRNELKTVLDLFESETKTKEVDDGIAEVTQKNQDAAAKRAAKNKEPTALESLGFKLFSKKPVEPAKKELSIIAQFYDSKANFRNLLKDLNKEIKEKEKGTEKVEKGTEKVEKGTEEVEKGTEEVEKTGIKAEEVEKTGIKAEVEAEVEAEGTGTGGRRKPRKSKRTRKSKRNRKSKRSRKY